MSVDYYLIEYLFVESEELILNCDRQNINYIKHPFTILLLVTGSGSLEIDTQSCRNAYLAST